MRLFAVRQRWYVFQLSKRFHLRVPHWFLWHPLPQFLRFVCFFTVCQRWCLHERQYRFRVRLPRGLLGDSLPNALRLVQLISMPGVIVSFFVCAWPDADSISFRLVCRTAASATTRRRATCAHALRAFLVSTARISSILVLLHRAPTVVLAPALLAASLARALRAFSAPIARRSSIRAPHSLAE